MFCRQCGAVLSQDSLFCPKCGTRIEDNVSQREVIRRQASQNTQGIKTVVNGMISMLIVVVTIFIVLCWQEPVKMDELFPSLGIKDRLAVSCAKDLLKEQYLEVPDSVKWKEATIIEKDDFDRYLIDLSFDAKNPMGISTRSHVVVIVKPQGDGRQYAYNKIAAVNEYEGAIDKALIIELAKSLNAWGESHNSNVPSLKNLGNEEYKETTQAEAVEPESEGIEYAMPEKNNNVNPQAPTWESMLSISAFSTQIRDEKGVVYQVLAFAEEQEREVYIETNSWAGAQEGETIYSGKMKLAYRVLGNTSYEIANLYEEGPYPEITLNLSRQLAYVVENEFTQSNDLLLIGEVEASAGSNIKLFNIVNGKPQLVQVEYEGQVMDSLFTCDTYKPFFRQTSANTFEVADYDNAETFKYYVDEYELGQDNTLRYTGNTKVMEIDEFNSYRE